MGDAETARREADAALEVARESGNPSLIGSALAFVGRARFVDDPDVALAAFEESIALTRAGAADGFHSMALGGARATATAAGDRVAALDRLRAAISFDHDVGNRANLGLAIERADRDARDHR